MTPAEMNKRIVRYGELVPYKTALIDAHSPGSDQKENFTIIGGGVSGVDGAMRAKSFWKKVIFSISQPVFSAALKTSALTMG